LKNELLVNRKIKSFREGLRMADKSLEQRIQRALDYQEVANVMSRYEWYLSAGQYDKVVELFAQKTPGVRAEVGSWGVYEGTAGIKRKFGRGGLDEWLQGKTGSLKPGVMNSQTNTTPVIEIAGDSKTAKGVWLCPGLATSLDESGKPKASWSWCKRAADFVKEDGKWKIWHYHVYGVFICPYEKSWADMDDPFVGLELPPLPDELKPDKPTTHPLWMYSPTRAVEYVPSAPEPYETFDEKTAY
jgi:hypothetical protein